MTNRKKNNIKIKKIPRASYSWQAGGLACFEFFGAKDGGSCSLSVTIVRRKSWSDTTDDPSYSPGCRLSSPNQHSANHGQRAHDHKRQCKNSLNGRHLNVLAGKAHLTTATLTGNGGMRLKASSRHP